MYQALYRKWRPRTFASVVGQEHITDTLRRQAAQNRLSHAYLFTGTRGTGKTTCAKILAKAVNCQNPQDGDPCGQCPACQGIDNGSLLDVLELDAASNNGVDHVRALRDEAVYSPASVRYRVYIVDEVHMLSTAAFNALLKILEEPPAHLIFILATTELHKVPATILSRCQRFAFKRIRPQDIARRLAYVAGQEGIGLTEEAAELLSRLADGALRDALSLLDQCAAAGGRVDSGRVLDVLGLTGNAQTAELLGHVLRRDAQSALTQLDKLYSSGKDVGALLGELTGLTRDLLIYKTAPQGGASLLGGGYDTALLEELGRDVAPARLIFMASQLQSTSAGLPLSANRRTDGELCLLRLCDESLCGDITALSARIARLEDRGASAPAAPPRAEPPAKREAPPPREEPVQEPAAPPWDNVPPLPEEAPPAFEEPPWDDGPPPYGEPVAAPASSSAEPAGERAPQPSVDPPEAAGGLWDELLDKYKGRLSPRYWSDLDNAAGALEEGMLVVRCGDDFTLETLDCPEVKEAVQDVTSQRLGRQVAVRFALGTGEAPRRDSLEELIRRGSRYDSFTVK